MPPKITRNHEYAKVLARTVKTNRGFTSLANTANAIDSADVTQILSTVSASSLEVYDTLDSLPTSSLTKGGQGYVKATQRLYVSDSFGWYSMALVNLTPTQTLDPSGNVTLSTDGTSTIVTITATDSDQPEAHLTYSVESDGNMLATGTTVTQDSSVFTITPLTADSGGVAGNFTLTFKTTDNVNIATTTKDFSLTFSTIVDSSAETILLMKAAGNSATNADITYQNSSDVSTGFTETGTPQASTFSPYRSGGYSAYFDGSGDYLQYAASNSTVVNWHSQSTTMEAWIYLNSSSDHLNDYPCIFSNGEEPGSAASTNYWGFGPEGATPYLKFQYYNGSSQAVTSSTQFPLREWVHVAMVHSSSTIKLYQNGVEVASASVLGTPQNSSSLGLVTGGAKNGVYNGYIRDARLVHSAVYTAAFTPPTEALTAIANTQVLLCHLPYFADGSTNDFAITIGGNTKTAPFGPYDYSPWTADDVGGSVYFGGSGDKISTPNSTDWDLSSGSWTIECWVYLTGSYASKYFTIYAKRISGGGATTSIEGFIRMSTGALSWFDGTQANSTGIVQPNTWSHCAWVHDGTNLKMFLNGKNVYNAARSVTERNYPLYIGGLDGNTGEDFEGSISDFRITKGTAKYSADFTPPTAPLSHDGSTTKMLMNNKLDANIYDASSSYLLELNGNTISSTTQRKFTTSSSMYFDGTGDYITIDDGFHFGTADFTFEFWLYPTENLTNATQLFINPETNGSGVTWSLSTNTYGGYNGLLFAYGQYGSYTVGKYVNNYWPPQNTWTHLAIQRRNGTIAIFVNGTSQTLATYNENSTFSDGADLTSNYTSRDFFTDLQGYVQDLRITKGYGRYAGNFTPSTTEFEL